MRKKSSIAVITAAATMLLAMAGLAWACSPQSSIVIIADKGPSARRTLVNGNVTPVQGSPVGSADSAPRLAEIRWNASNGPLLAQVAPGPTGDFSTEVSLPQASPGVYYVVLTSAAKDVARVAVQVTEPGSSSSRSVSSGLWTGFATSSGGTDATAVSSAARAVAPGAGMLAGIGLAAFGVAASAMGLSIAALNKRRAAKAGVSS